MGGTKSLRAVNRVAERQKRCLADIDIKGFDTEMAKVCPYPSFFRDDRGRTVIFDREGAGNLFRKMGSVPNGSCQ